MLLSKLRPCSKYAPDKTTPFYKGRPYSNDALFKKCLCVIKWRPCSKDAFVNSKDTPVQKMLLFKRTTLSNGRPCSEAAPFSIGVLIPF